MSKKEKNSTKSENPLKPFFKMFYEKRTLTLLDLAFLVLYAVFLGALLTVLNPSLGYVMVGIGVLAIVYKIVEKFR